MREVASDPMTASEVTEEVVARFSDSPDPRIGEIMRSLVRHLHAFAAEVRLTQEEWLAGIRISEVEQAIADHQASLAKLHDELDLPMAAMDVLAPPLDRLPAFRERLWELSQRELRRLFDSLDLTITYDHKRRMGRVSITLPTDAQRVRDSGPCPGRDSNARPTA
jgi:Catechol dioxygenase N terminus